MQTLVGALLVTLLCGLSLTASISGEPETANALNPYMGMAKAAPSDQAYLNWLRYVLRQKQQQQAAVEAEKRMSDFSMPYMKYRQDKRNNGIWVWMPAQGYVSVPHQQEENGDAMAKQGKIMRYGK